MISECSCTTKNSALCFYYAILLSDCILLLIHCFFMQGDILFLHMSKDPIRTGEIVVFNVDVTPTSALPVSLYRISTFEF
jgi:hypothetical protein